MPWDSFRESKGWCIYKLVDGKKSGESLGCHEEEGDADKQLRALYASTDETFSRDETGFGWTLVAVAAVNRPGARQRGYDITVVERNGQMVLRAPIIKKSVVRNKGRTYKFDQGFFDNVLRNHERGVCDSAPYLRVSHEPGDARPPALGWFDAESGGELVQEENWLVGYALPTSDEALETVKRKEYRYASADIHPDYRSNELAVLETAEFETYPEDHIFVEEDNTMTVTLEEALVQIEQLKTDMVERDERVTELEAQVTELEDGQSDDDDHQDLEVPEWVKEKLTKLEAENIRLEEERVKSAQIAEFERRKATVAEIAGNLKSFRNDSGHGYSAAVVNTFEQVALSQPVKGSGDEIIVQLEDGEELTLAALLDYFIAGAAHLVRQSGPTVQLEGNTHGVESKPESLTGAFGMTPEQMQDFYKNSADRAWGVQPNEEDE